MADIKSNSDAGSESDPASGTVCHALADILESGVDVHRCLAAKALGRIGDQSAVQPLIKALLDEDEDVRTDAAQALLALGNAGAADQLFENLLGDPCSDVKLAAITALAGFRDSRVTPWLRRMVKGRDEEIAWDEEEYFTSGWDDWVEIQIRAITALGDLGATVAVPDIVAALTDENAQDMAEPAFEALAKMGPEGIDALAGFLSQNDTRLRRRAASVLASLTEKEAQEPLALALADPVAGVRMAALRSRSKVCADDPVLAGLLTDADIHVRTMAAELIGRYHSDSLRALLEDPSAKVQTAALLAYAKTQDMVADDLMVERLSRKINSREADLANAAATRLAAIAPGVALVELAKLLTNTERPVPIRLGALRGLTAIGNDGSIEALVAVINDDERQIRLETMSALAKLAAGDAAWPNLAGTTLLAALNGGYDPEVEEDGDVPAPEPVEETAEAGEDETVEVADDDADAPDVFPTSTLDSMLQEEPTLAAAIGLPEQGVELTKTDMERLAIAKRVVGKRKMAAEPIVVQHEDIRRFASRVLGDLDHSGVVIELARALDTDDAEMRLAVADSLARIGARGNSFDGTVTAVLLESMATEDRDLKLLLIRALAACESEEVVDLLQAELDSDDSFVRNEAIHALGGNEKARAAIMALLSDPDPSVRLSAAEAIALTPEPELIDTLVEFALSHEGYHGRQTARLLLRLDAGQASAGFLDILADPARKRVWSVAIEALEELNQKQHLRLAETIKQDKGRKLL